MQPKLDDEALVRSVYFSQDRFEDPDQRERYGKDLDAVGEALRSGEPVSVDERELQRLRAQLRAVQEVRWRNVFGALFRIFLPALAVLIVIYGAIAALRHFR